MRIITEEMNYRKQMCEYAIRNGVTKASRRYHTYRKFVYRQLERYNGTARSLALRTRRPHKHPNQHTEKEYELLKHVRKQYQCDGLAEMYVQALKRGYKRSYGSMVKQISKINKEYGYKRRKTRITYQKHTEVRGEYPGDKVQVDIKYVPKGCIKFDALDKKYYQITAIDEYSRKRRLKIVDEKSVTHTARFIITLEKELGFRIKTIQTDNGSEFVNNQEETKELTAFEEALRELKINHRRTRPYSPWQNGKVERSHKIDTERFYSKQEFTSEEDLIKKVKRYESRYNNISRKILGFKSPNEIVKQYSI